MTIQHINIPRPQLLQTILKTNMQSLRTASCVVTLYLEVFPIVCLIPRRILGCNNHLVSHTPLLHPSPNQPFAVFGVVGVRGIDEIPTQRVKRIEEREGVVVGAEGG